MHTKIVDPKNSGNKAVYNNNSSSKRLINYMDKENSDKDIGIFFNEVESNIRHNDVVKHIDNNVKGLKTGDAKFDSIIVSPSNAELEFIGNDPEKLKEFTRGVMINYAENFDFTVKNKVNRPVKLLAHGVAKYQYKEEASKSYFIKFLDGNNKERIIWGKDLSRAIEHGRPEIGDMIHIDHLGMQDVIVPISTKQEDGSYKSIDTIVKRNEWSIVSEQYRIDNPLKIREPGPKITPELVWFAIIHNTREYELKDQKVSKRVQDLREQGYSRLEVLSHAKNDLFLLKYKPNARDLEHFYDNGAVKKGDLKPGDNRHIHIVVSRRDKEMKLTLNNINRNRFDRREFFTKNANSFENLFNFIHTKRTLDEKRLRMFGLRIDHLNKKYNFAPGYLNKAEILDIYRTDDFKKNFAKNFWKLENNFINGNIVADPESFLKYGSDRIQLEKDHSLSLSDMVGSFRSVGGAMGVGDDGETANVLQNIRKRLLKRQRHHDKSIKR